MNRTETRRLARLSAATVLLSLAALFVATGLFDTGYVEHDVSGLLPSLETNSAVAAVLQERLSLADEPKPSILVLRDRPAVVVHGDWFAQRRVRALLAELSP